MTHEPEGRAPLSFDPSDRDALYDWLATELRRFGYVAPGKADKGRVRQYPPITQLRQTGQMSDPDPATRMLCKRACGLFANNRYRRLAGSDVVINRRTCVLPASPLEPSFRMHDHRSAGLDHSSYRGCLAGPTQASWDFP